MYELLIDLADKEENSVFSNIPKDPFVRYYHFFEMTRVLEYWAVFYEFIPENSRPSPPVLSMLKWGWNLAAEVFFCKITKLGFPMWKSTKETCDFAFNILHRLGRSVLLRRAADMYKYGHITVESVEGVLVFKRSLTDFQVVDNMEYEFLKELNGKIRSDNRSHFNGWELIEIAGAESYPVKEGAFYGHLCQAELDALKLINVDEVMEPLVCPWDSGYGIMLSYDALPDVDAHFFALALELVVSWREEAGVHPSVKFKGFSGAELSVVVATVVSLHLKHMRFVSIAGQKYPEVSTLQSLTIWCSEVELVTDVSAISKLDPELVGRVVKSLVFMPEDTGFLNGQTTPFNPLLIGLGNGLLIKKVSSVVDNPFSSIIKLMQWRDSSVQNTLAYHREAWQRSSLYHLFLGTRYRCVEGNINLRADGKDLTDIDAAVLDTVTGDVALFQLKWQDYFTNDVKRLRSKASNLAKELDTWADRVEFWIERFGVGALMKNLRLDCYGKGTAPRVYLFAISWSVARVKGYGFEVKNKSLSIMTWPQLQRVRAEIGPLKNTFHELFLQGQAEADLELPSIDYPYRSTFSSEKIEFLDLWRGY